MHNEYLDNSNSGFTLQCSQSSNSISYKELITFENFTLLFSVIGPVLLLGYFILAIPIYEVFNSISNNSQLHLFRELYLANLISLLKLLFAAGLFSGIGMMFGLIHKKAIIFSADFIAFFISFGFVLPTLIMALGD